MWTDSLLFQLTNEGDIFIACAFQLTFATALIKTEWYSLCTGCGAGLSGLLQISLCRLMRPEFPYGEQISRKELNLQHFSL